jgi:hypothetical protein
MNSGTENPAFWPFIKTAVQEMRPYIPGEDLTGISVSPEDKPEFGGMIARNSENHADQWYVSKKFFRKNYKTSPCVPKKMNFGQAIELLKQGKRVAREGWNGLGMFLWLKPAAEIKSEWCSDPVWKRLVDDNSGTIEALGTICMYTHGSTGRRAILAGWVASQSDMLLEDWVEIE